MKKFLAAILGLGACVALTAAHAEPVINWPDGKKAAIALTYDDALESQLDNALPILDKYGLKGTFYIIAGRDIFFDHVDEWKAVAKNGHELGNHTMYHACRGSLPNRDWVAPGADLDTYTLDRIVGEVRVTNRILAYLDGKAPQARSFAYPCGESATGGESYVEAVSGDFIAARGVAQGIVDFNGANVDRMHLPIFARIDPPGETLIAYAQQVLDAGGLGTYLFHGIGGDHLVVSAEAHKELIVWLAEHEDEIWIAPVAEIMAYVNAQQAAAKD